MPNLLFCLTPGSSLHKWHTLGTLGREMRPYLEYARRGWRVRIITFRREHPRAYALPPSIGLVWFPHWRLLPFLALLRPDLGVWADVIKTNQSAGGWHYVRAARCWRKPILLRCGYVAGKNLEHADGLTFAVRKYQQREAWAFREADQVQVSTPVLGDWIKQRYRTRPERISIGPNFVDTALFRANPTMKADPFTVIAVGRMVTLKRLDLLIRACARARIRRLTLIGDGPDRARLDALASAVGLSCEMPGQRPNEELPILLAQHELYAQVSAWEGHPKTLIEAMACARPCIIARAPGLAEQVEHDRTGWTVEPTEECLASALSTLTKDPGLRSRLGVAARDHVVATMSFKALFEQEFGVACRLAGRGETSDAASELEHVAVSDG